MRSRKEREVWRCRGKRMRRRKEEKVEKVRKIVREFKVRFKKKLWVLRVMRVKVTGMVILMVALMVAWCVEVVVTVEAGEDAMDVNEVDEDGK